MINYKNTFNIYKREESNVDFCNLFIRELSLNELIFFLISQNSFFYNLMTFFSRLLIFIFVLNNYIFFNAYFTAQGTISSVYNSNTSLGFGLIFSKELLYIFISTIVSIFLGKILAYLAFNTFNKIKYSEFYNDKNLYRIRRDLQIRITICFFIILIISAVFNYFCCIYYGIYKVASKYIYLDIIINILIEIIFSLCWCFVFSALKYLGIKEENQ